MAAILQKVNGGSFKCNALPYARGLVIPVFDMVAETLALRDIHLKHEPVLKPTPVTEITNGNTGNFFADIDEAILFAIDHILPIGNAGQNLLLKPFDIKDVPATDSEKPVGLTVQDESFTGASLLVFFKNNTPHLSGFILAGDTISLTPATISALVDGDEILIFGTKPA